MMEIALYSQTCFKQLAIIWYKIACLRQVLAWQRGRWDQKLLLKTVLLQDSTFYTGVMKQDTYVTTMKWWSFEQGFDMILNTFGWLLAVLGRGLINRDAFTWHIFSVHLLAVYRRWLLKTGGHCCRCDCIWSLLDEWKFQELSNYRQPWKKNNYCF